MAGGQKLEAQMLKIKRPDPQRFANARQHCRRLGRLPDQLDVALSGDQGVEGVEQDADRGGQPQALSLCPGPFSKRDLADCNCSERADCWRMVTP